MCRTAYLAYYMFTAATLARNSNINTVVPLHDSNYVVSLSGQESQVTALVGSLERASPNGEALVALAATGADPLNVK